MNSLQKLFYIFFFIFFVGCTAKVNAPQSELQSEIETNYSTACAKGACPCSSPLGPIVDGGTAIAYDTSSVTCGSTCQPHEIKLTCKNGKFDREIQDLSFSCQVNACKACTVGNNQVPHGFTVQMFNKSTVSCGQSCDDNKRALVCKDGNLQGTLAGASADGKDSEYNQAVCLSAACSCAIPDGGTLTAGGAMKFYKSATGTCDIPCDNAANVVTKTCVQTGTAENPTYAFSGDSTFSKSSCLERPPSLCGCTLPDANKTILPHGRSQDLFTLAAPTNCNTCAQIKITAHCAEGVLYDKPSSDNTRAVLSASALNSHRILSCDQAATLDCSINNICVANGASKTLYGKTPLTCSDDPAASKALFACSSKNLLKDNVAYQAAGDTYATTWREAAPTNSCVGCALPWGGSVSADSEVNMFRSSGNSSNSCGTGCKQYTMKCRASDRKFTSGDPAIDADFEANKSLYTQTCNNQCTQEGGGAPPRFCLLPWQNSFVSADALVPMWKKKVVEYGDSCQNYFKLGRCLLSSGTFDAGINYIYKSCTELPFNGVRIDSISPKYVAPAGGSITLTGTGFATGMQIKIGQLNCGSVSVIGSTQATCSAPSNSAGVYDVTVDVSAKKAVKPQGLSYYNGTCTAGPGMAVYKYTGSNQTFTVPAGCTSVTAYVWGAGGGGRQLYNSEGIMVAQVGGAGGFSSGTFNVSSGVSLTVVVGGGGNGGWYQGSSGGGYSGIFSSGTVSATTAIIIAGAGGGAGEPSGCNKGGTGGEGGGETGGTHGNCSGLGGTQTAGGAGGSSGKSGSSLNGGNIGTLTNGYAGQGRSSSYTSGGGGGGGYYGGGSGSEITGLAGAGGGGSGYTAPSVTNAVKITGSGRRPPKSDHEYYLFGVGMGGHTSFQYYSPSTGGPGYIVISY